MTLTTVLTVGGLLLFFGGLAIGSAYHYFRYEQPQQVQRKPDGDC